MEASSETSKYLTWRCYFIIKKLLTICGIASKHKNVFLPIAFVMAPKNIVPINPPIQNIDTIHDISFVVNGPSSNGDLSADCNVAKLTEGQPQYVP